MRWVIGTNGAQRIDLIKEKWVKNKGTHVKSRTPDRRHCTVDFGCEEKELKV
jgi:hypothetical protein